MAAGWGCGEGAGAPPAACSGAAAGCGPVQRGKAGPKSRLRHGSGFSHPVLASTRKSPSEGRCSPSRGDLPSPFLWLKTPPDSRLCRPPDRIFRPSMLFLLQGISIDATAQPALFLCCSRGCPGVWGSWTRPGLVPRHRAPSGTPAAWAPCWGPRGWQQPPLLVPAHKITRRRLGRGRGRCWRACVSL